MVYGAITDSDGNPNVFNVNRNDDGKSWLNDNWAKSDNKWNSDNEIVFHLRNFFFSALQVAVFLFWIIQTIFPTSKHFTNLSQLKSDFLILFMRNKFCLPSDGNDKFKSI